jgi:hypothetical protein
LSLSDRRCKLKQLLEAVDPNAADYRLAVLAPVEPAISADTSSPSPGSLVSTGA